jgi:uncharacterized repeat protein (TIGR01451 family)
MGANLAITAGDSPNPVAVGQPLTYTLAVTNTGPFDASGVVVTDTLPAGVTFVSATSNPPAACSEAGGIITCNFGSLANGAQTTVTIIGTAGTAGLKTNTAGVAGNENDLFTANNSATTSTITPGPGCYDVNASGGVDIADIALVAAAWRATDAISLALYDFNGSGRVDIADILAAAAHWGESCL